MTKEKKTPELKSEKAEAPLVYNYHPVTGEFLGASVARLDPLDKIPMVPAHATLVSPPSVEEGYAAVFLSGEWTAAPDYRGQEFFNAEGEKIIITAIGEEPKKTWTKDKPEIPLTIAQIRIQRDVILQESDWTQLPDSPLDDKKRERWAKYRQELRDLPATGDPATIVFPQKPAK